MKIARITQFFPPKIGGLEFHAFELTKRHARDGAEVHVFTTSGPVPALPAGAVVHRIRPVRGLPSTSLRALLFWIKALPAVVGEHRRRAFDVIHAHGDFVDAALLGWLGRLLRVPTVITMHGGLSKHWAYRMVAGGAFSLPDHVVAVSTQIKKDLVELGVPAERITVRSSGFDPELFQGQGVKGLSLKGACPLIVSVGRLHPVKGFDVLLQAASKMVARGSCFRLIIVGTGPEEKRLKAMAAPLPNVLFLGERPKDEIAALLRAAEIFVLASVELPGQREGLPTALLEAMAAGRPCVITSKVAASELVVHGENAWIVPAGSPEALAEALLYLLESSERRVALGAKAKASVDRYDWDTVAEEIMRIYQGLVR
ncbi:MAG: glycosyltransferase family 4 protein [Bacillota bacterium]